jgi:hypothetical protein
MQKMKLLGSMKKSTEKISSRCFRERLNLEGEILLRGVGL